MLHSMRCGLKPVSGHPWERIFTCRCTTIKSNFLRLKILGFPCIIIPYDDKKQKYIDNYRNYIEQYSVSSWCVPFCFVFDKF